MPRLPDGIDLSVKKIGGESIAAKKKVNETIFVQVLQPALFADHFELRLELFELESLEALDLLALLEHLLLFALLLPFARGFARVLCPSDGGFDVTWVCRDGVRTTAKRHLLEKET